MLDAPGREFWWPEANQAFFDAIKEYLKPDLPVYELNCNINHDEFADAVTNKMLEFLQDFTKNPQPVSGHPNSAK